MGDQHNENGDILDTNLDDFLDLDEKTISERVTEYDDLADLINNNDDFNSPEKKGTSRQSSTSAQDILDQLNSRHSNMSSNPMPDLSGIQLDVNDLLAEDADPLDDIKNSQPTSQMDDVSSLISEEEEDDDDAEEQVKFKDITKNLMIALVLIIVISVVVFLVYGNKASEPAETTTPPAETKEPEEVLVDVPTINNQLNVGLYDAESLVANKEMKTDYLILTKHLVTWDNSIYTVISGTTTKNQIPIKVFVQPEIYNSLKDGQIITVYYNEVIFNDQQYSINYSLGEVVGE